MRLGLERRTGFSLGGNEVGSIQRSFMFLYPSRLKPFSIERSKISMSVSKACFAETNSLSAVTKLSLARSSPASLQMLVGCELVPCSSSQETVGGGGGGVSGSHGRLMTDELLGAI